MFFFFEGFADSAKTWLVRDFIEAEKGRPAKNLTKVDACLN